MHGTHGADLPLPLEIRPDHEVMAAVFPDGDPTPLTPLGAAFLWWTALLGRDEGDAYRVALEKPSANRADWHGYGSTAERLDGCPLAKNLIESDDRPGEVAYAKLIKIAVKNNVVALPRRR